ncbi:MAG: amino acid decarboxylase, partial [Thermoleophilaceae bacterium]
MSFAELSPDRRTEASPSPQSLTPYLDALVEYAMRDPARFHVPGHKGGLAAPARMTDRLGTALSLDVPACIDGIDIGARPTPLEQAESLAAEAWEARRTWFLLNGASEGSHIACLALAHAGESVIVQRNVHSSTIHG